MAELKVFKKVHKSEEEVKEIFRRYVTPERYPQFIQDNLKSIQRIALGQISDILVLNNNQTGDEYKARIHGVVKHQGENGYEKFDCVYEKAEVVIAEKMKIGDTTVTLTPEQINQLKTEGRLDSAVEAENGNKIIIALDQELNRLTFSNSSKLKMPQKLHGVDLTEQQGLDLAEGKTIEYQREAPFNGKDFKVGDMLQMKAYYDPVLRTIRSNNVLDEKGAKVVIKSEVIIDKGVKETNTKEEAKETTKTKKTTKKVVKTEVLKDVEKNVKKPVQRKTSVKKNQTQSM